MDVGILKSLVSAIAGALLTLGFQVAMNWWRRPRLLIDGMQGVGFRVGRTGQVDGSNVPLVWLRIRIRNVGRSTAKNVKVFVTRYGDLSSGEAEAQRLGTDPAPLFWSHSDFLSQVDARIVTSLPPRTHQFADFLVAQNEMPPLLRLNSPIDDGSFLTVAAAGNGAEVELMAVDDNGHDAFKTLTFEWNGDSAGLQWKK